MDKEYQLYISFPRGYSIKDSTKYPVLYVLDGLYRFPEFKSARECMDFDKELEDFIIVGLGSGIDFVSWNTNRKYDFTPSEDTIYDRQKEKEACLKNGLDWNLCKGTLHSGGAEKFLRCITTEIIPFVDKHYKTTNDRGITGHSLGGLFTAWCFLNSKGLFNRYGINSPSFWWDNKKTLTQAELLFNKNETWDIPSTKVFISVGEKEGSTMVPDMVKFNHLLESKANKNVSVYSHQFQGETHNSVIPVSLKRTILVLYGKEK